MATRLLDATDAAWVAVLDRLARSQLQSEGKQVTGADLPRLFAPGAVGAERADGSQPVERGRLQVDVDGVGGAHDAGRGLAKSVAQGRPDP